MQATRHVRFALSKLHRNALVPWVLTWTSQCTRGIAQKTTNLQNLERKQRTFYTEPPRPKPRRQNDESDIMADSALGCFGNVLGGRHMLPGCAAAFKAWHSCIQPMTSGKDVPDVSDPNAMFSKFVQRHVHKDVLFAPPTYFSTYTGRGPFVAILHTVAQVFGPTFKCLSLSYSLFVCTILLRIVVARNNLALLLSCFHKRRLLT